MKLLFLAVLITGSLCQLGCNKGENAQAEAKLDEIKVLQQAHSEKMLDQIENDGGMVPDLDYVGDMADRFDDMADGLGAKDAAMIRDQANVLRELQDLVTPYTEVLNAFIELGGLDINTLGSEEGFAQRLEMIRELAKFNDEIDEKYAPLMRKLGGDPAVVSQTLSLTKQIRETDRVLFANMIPYLEILRDHWDLVEPQPSGDVVFAESMDDGVIEQFNAHAETINRVSTEQAVLQRMLVQLNQP